MRVSLTLFILEFIVIVGCNSQGRGDGMCEDCACRGCSFETNFFNKPDIMFIDHREHFCLPKPRDQGPMNHDVSHIFSAIALFEWIYCIQTNGKQLAFSEQYPIDCYTKVSARTRDGRPGGKVVRALRWMELFGFETLESYPYLGQKSICPYDLGTERHGMGYLRLTSGRMTLGRMELKKNVEQRLKFDPIIVELIVNDEFDNYEGGVAHIENCELANVFVPKKTVALLLVGFGREKNENYYLLMNSRGQNWGEKGYYKLSHKSKSCFLNNSGWWIAARFEVNSNYVGPRKQVSFGQFLKMSESD